MERGKPDSDAGTDELRRGYDASSLKGGVRGKYIKRYSAGTNLVRLDADVSRTFPNDNAWSNRRAAKCSALKWNWKRTAAGSPK